MNYFKHPKYIKPENKQMKVADAVEHFKKAYTKFMGVEPTKIALCMIVSQAILETGWFKAGLYCYNFGNTKCNPNKLEDGEYFTMFRCSEVLNGKEVFFDPPHFQTIFQAFKSPEDGAKHHIKFLATRERYREAWSKIINHKHEEYILELSKAGYFTANYNLYNRVFLSIYKKLLPTIDQPDEIFDKKEAENNLRLVSVSINKNLKI
jgi:flagellum-specific peptidoglycan hydrolase FlgJ